MKVDVTEIFDSIMADTLRHAYEAHGEKAMHHLFFELYDHTFSFLDREFGPEAVEAYWAHIADHQLGALEELMKTKGFAGMQEYWRQTLGQEGADHEMKMTDDSFTLRVKHCPPMDWFRSRNIQHYPRYRDHCRLMSGRIAERCGFHKEYIEADPDAGYCCGGHFTRKDPG